MDKKQIHVLSNQKDWQEFLQLTQFSQCAVLFKFSPTCPISHRAESQAMRWIDFVSENSGIIVAQLDVIAARALSRQIADELNVQHQSPQVIYLSPQGKVIWDASHGSISVQSLTTHIKTPNDQQAIIS